MIIVIMTYVTNVIFYDIGHYPPLHIVISLSFPHLNLSLYHLKYFL